MSTVRIKNGPITRVCPKDIFNSKWKRLGYTIWTDADLSEEVAAIEKAEAAGKPKKK